MKNIIVLYSTQSAENDKNSYSEQMIKGLSKPQKQIPMKFNYDEQGSKLCANIQQSQAYYLWRCDKNILEKQGSEMLKMMGDQKFNLIDLGAGDATKTKQLISIALKEGKKLQYIPLDISQHSNQELLQTFKKQFPTLDMSILTAQFQQGIQWVQKNKKQKNVYLFVGSTFGNDSWQDNVKFADMLDKNLKKGDQFYVGLDLWKDPEVITRAYLDNPYERTFLINNLNRMNKQLGANFDLTKFYGFPYFDPYQKYIKGLIISAENQQAQVCGKTFKFSKSEVIQMHISRKWVIEDVDKIFQKTGFKQIGSFIDDKKYFAYVVLQKI